jgi:hypothetical protein
MSPLLDYSARFIEQQVRRSSRNLLIVNGIIVGLVVLATLALSSYFLWFFHGPLAVDDAYILAAAKGPPSSLIAYVVLPEHRLIPAGLVEESRRNGKTYSVNPYFFVEVGDRLLLVKGDGATKGSSLIGPLESATAKTDQQALDALMRKNSRVLPIMLNAAAAFEVFGYVALGLIGLILLPCGYNVVRALIGGGRPYLHPVMRALCRHGEAPEVAETIDAEVADSSALQIGKAWLTRNWVLRPTFFGIVVCPLDEIVWAFPARVVGDNVASLALRSGRMIGIALQKNTPELLALLYQRIPWAEKGYDEKRLGKWRKQRAEFIADVEARRQSWVTSIPD